MVKNILVLGATGTQGIPAVKELVNKRFSVWGMSREGSAKAAKLSELGAHIVNGDLFDEESLYQAMQGMDGVLFIPPIASSGDPIPELTVGLNVVHAAERAGISHLIHTSVDRAGDQETFKGWGDSFGYNYRTYWLAKSGVIDFIKASNIPCKTIFKPAFIMEDFIPPLVNSAFPTLKNGIIATAVRPERKMALISVEDQAKLIAEAFSDPAKFDRKEIPLAGDNITLCEAADIIASVTGKQVRAVTMAPEEFRTNQDVVEAFGNVYGEHAEFALAGTLEAYEWDNNDGYTATPKDSEEYGVKLSSFSDWAMRHENDFVIG